MSKQSSIWRNPVLILVFVLPAISIIAGVGLLVMALRTGGDDPVLDEVRRTARGAQVTDLSADQAAAAGRYAAVVRVDAEGFTEIAQAELSRHAEQINQRLSQAAEEDGEQA